MAQVESSTETVKQTMPGPAEALVSNCPSSTSTATATANTSSIEYFDTAPSARTGLASVLPVSQAQAARASFAAGRATENAPTTAARNQSPFPASAATEPRME